MALFKLMPFGVQRTAEDVPPQFVGKVTSSPGSMIPPDTSNGRWNEYLAWVALGNVADAADPPPVPLTPAQIIDAIQADPNGHLATFARGLIQVLASRFSLTPAQVLTAIRNAAT